MSRTKNTKPTRNDLLQQVAAGLAGLGLKGELTAVNAKPPPLLLVLQLAGPVDDHSYRSIERELAEVRKHFQDVGVQRVPLLILEAGVTLKVEC